jgi:hypothetical protein
MGKVESACYPKVLGKLRWGGSQFQATSSERVFETPISTERS